MIIDILLVIFIIADVVGCYIIWNLMKKTEMLETWVETFTQRIEKIQTDLKDIDSTGHFESDDEIGTIFEQIKEVINELDELKGEDVDAS